LVAFVWTEVLVGRLPVCVEGYELELVRCDALELGKDGKVRVVVKDVLLTYLE
jgi:hypothetical protein